MTTTFIEGQLQIDHERGVIYFHASKADMMSGCCPTPLRICGIKEYTMPPTWGDKQIDITLAPMGDVKISAS